MRLWTISWTGLEVGRTGPDIDGLVHGLDELCSFIMDQSRHLDGLVGPLGALVAYALHNSTSTLPNYSPPSGFTPISKGTAGALLTRQPRSSGGRLPSHGIAE